MFIDVHCHMDSFENPEEIVENARKSKVNLIISNGTNPEKNRKVIDLAKEFPEIKIALGIYPIECLSMSEKQIKQEIEFIRKNKEKVIAIGEVGMDFKENKDIELQTRNLSLFINLAKELDIPIIVHSRKAELECIDLLEKMEMKKVVMHCFSGKMSLVKRIIQNGWMFSIPAAINNSEHFQKIVELAPMELLLGETDSPYLHPMKEWPNEPANVIVSYKKISEIKEIPLAETERQIESNFHRIFKK